MKRRTFLTYFPRARLTGLAELNRPAFTSIANTKHYSSTPNDKMTDSQSHEEEKKGTPLGLPEPPADGIKLDVSSGEGVALDHLGPMVVNKDGTISRITNWDNMAEIEKKNTLRILQKRNKQRLEALKQAGQDESK
ncbi:hypothetical protein E4T47_05366 [Aureobasidium subglaciale]|nr:hypothetical protein E4T47_05366 [Aureobasidium subglaciale]